MPHPRRKSKKTKTKMPSPLDPKTIKMIMETPQMKQFVDYVNSIVFEYDQVSDLDFKSKEIANEVRIRQDVIELLEKMLKPLIDSKKYRDVAGRMNREYSVDVEDIKPKPKNAPTN